MKAFTPEQQQEAVELLRVAVAEQFVMDWEMMNCDSCGKKYPVGGEMIHKPDCWHTRAQALLSAIESEDTK